MEVPVPISGFGPVSADALLHSLSCGLREPVIALPQLLGKLAESSLGSRQRAALEAAALHAGRIQGLLADAEAWASLATGAPSRWKSAFSVRDLIDESIETLEERAARHHTEIRSRPPSAMTDQVRAEESLLAVVLNKITGHCLDHTREGQIVIQARFQASAGGVGQLLFEIRDTGTKLAPESIENYFEPGKSGTDPRRGDAGFSLALAKALVHSLGGQLTVQAGSLGGALFQFSIPVEGLVPSDSDSAGPLFNCFRSYLVQDRLKPSSLLQSKLIDWCGQCLTVDETALWRDLDSLANGTTGQVTLVLLDLKTTPDNLDLAKRILNRRSNPSLKIITLADVHLPPSEEALLGHGIDGLVTRPFRVAELRRCLETVFAGGRATSASTPAPLLQDSVPIIKESVTDKRRVLLVDDNPINRKVGTKQLERLGFYVESANNGEEAVAAVARQPWDCVLMDCMMPVMDGFEATRRIRLNESAQAKRGSRRTLIIALTANVSDKHRELCFEAGMDDFLGKPVLADELKATIDRLAAENRPVTPSWTELDEAVLDTAITPKPETRPVAAPVPAPAAQAAPTPAGLDLSRLMEMTDGDQTIIDELVKMYVDQTDEQFAELEAALNKGDAPGVRRLAHSACGASNSIGVTGFVSELREIEKRAEAGSLEGLLPIFGKVKATYATIAAWLRANVLGKGAARTVTPAPAAFGPAESPLNPAIIDALRLSEGADFEPFFNELANSFRTEADRRARELSEALAAKKSERLGESARALRTVGANLGADRLATACQRLEELSSGAEWSSIEHQVQALDREIRIVSEHLNKEVAQSHQV
jgi:two-component system, sensor histidine kinase and response regulator